MGYALGAADYLTKPIDTSALARVLARHRVGNGQANRVLIIDDDPGTRELLRRTLAAEDYTVMEAVDGLKGVACLKRARPDAVILDLMLPGMDGFEVLETMRRDEAWRHIPVVVVTAQDLTREEVAWLNGHASKVFQKGAYGRAELAGVVHGLITRNVDGPTRERGAAAI
jgi:DNA-binding response OmpR family regulator